MNGSTGPGLALFLDTIRGFVSGGGRDRREPAEDDAVVNATVLGMVFDAPGVVQAIQERVLSEDRKFMVFVVDAIGYPQKSLSGDAYATLGATLGDITEYTETEMVQRAPVAWQCLKDFHMRQSLALAKLKNDLRYADLTCEDCRNMEYQLRSRLTRAEGVHQVKEAWRGSSVGRCEDCRDDNHVFEYPVDTFLSMTSMTTYGSKYIRQP